MLETDTSKYSQQEHTISALEGNIKAIGFALPIILLFGIPFLLIWGSPSKELQEILHSDALQIGVNLAIFIIGIVVHELIHGIIWAIYTKNGIKSIKFGILKPSMTPYCHCKEMLWANQYRIGVIMPAIITGFLQSIIAIIIGNPYLLIIGIIFTIAAAGDFLVMWMLRKEHHSLVSDHPSKIGFIVYKEI